MYLGVGVTVDGLNMSLCGQGFGVPSGVGVAAEGLNMSLCGQGFGVPCGVGVAAVGSPELGVLGNRYVGAGVGVNIGGGAQGPVHRSLDM